MPEQQFFTLGCQGESRADARQNIDILAEIHFFLTENTLLLFKGHKSSVVGTNWEHQLHLKAQKGGKNER